MTRFTLDIHDVVTDDFSTHGTNCGARVYEFKTETAYARFDAASRTIEVSTEDMTESGDHTFEIEVYLADWPGVPLIVLPLNVKISHICQTT